MSGLRRPESLGIKRGRSSAAMGKDDRLGDRAMSRFDVLHMIKRRVEAAGLPYSTCCHTLGLPELRLICRTAARSNTPRPRQSESPRTTKLYDLTREELSFEEVERINI